MRVLWTLVSGLLCFVLSGLAWADPTPIEKCADSCAKVVNVCLHGDPQTNPPNMAEACKDVPECRGVDAAEFAVYSTWFANCLKNPGTCHQACVAPKVTPVPATQGGSTTPAPTATTTTKAPPVALSYKEQCVKFHHGFYTKTEAVENGIKVVREQCYKISDAKREIAELKQEIESHNSVNQYIFDLYARVAQLVGAVNGHTELLREAQQTLKGYEKLDNRLGSVETRVGQTEHNINVVAGKVALLEAKPGTAPVPGQTTNLVIQKSGLPCWVAGYGQSNLHSNYGMVIGSLGAELGCSLFGSSDGAHSFVLVGGGGVVPKEYFDHKLVELHALAGYKYRDESYELLLTGGGKWLNSTTWEKGTMSWYGILPEGRYLLGKDKDWFIGARVGLGVLNVAPPLPPDQIANGRATHFSASAWALLGKSF